MAGLYPRDPDGATPIAYLWARTVRCEAVVTLRPGETGRHYRLPNDADYAAVRKAQERVARMLDEWERGGRQGLCPVPDEPLPPIGTLGFRVQRYGMMQRGDLFTAWQKVAFIILSEVISLISIDKSLLC